MKNFSILFEVLSFLAYYGVFGKEFDNPAACWIADRLVRHFQKHYFNEGLTSFKYYTSFSWKVGRFVLFHDYNDPEWSSAGLLAPVGPGQEPIGVLHHFERAKEETFICDHCSEPFTTIYIPVDQTYMICDLCEMEANDGDGNSY